MTDENTPSSATFTTIADVAAADDLGKKVDDEVAVYYAYGEINDSQGFGFSQEHQITTKATITDLQKLRKDKDVKAVVIRVNSPGGSAFASEQIWHEIQLLRAEKPVVISMGGLAASGGYYISCGANKIFAEPMTLTGSIGIFGMIPDASELLTQKLGLTFDVVKTNAMSDFGASHVEARVAYTFQFRADTHHLLDVHLRFHTKPSFAYFRQVIGNLYLHSVRYAFVFLDARIEFVEFLAFCGMQEVLHHSVHPQQTCNEDINLFPGFEDRKFCRRKQTSTNILEFHLVVLVFSFALRH